MYPACKHEKNVLCNLLEQSLYKCQSCELTICVLHCIQISQKTLYWHHNLNT